MEPLSYAWSVRSKGDNLFWPLMAEVEGGLGGLRPSPVGSDAASASTGSELS